MSGGDSNALIRLRFLRNIGRDVYVRITEIDHHFDISGDAQDTEAVQQHNMAREREIFLRAALQLLNQRESRGPVDTSVSARKPGKAAAAAAEADGEMYDVIRLGILRKCSRSGKFSAMAAGNMSHWKMKYVEVRHGALSYDDYHGSNDHHNMQTMRSYEATAPNNRRYIHLSIDSCICRVVQSGRVFEIAMVGGPRRFWMANTPEECLEWVKAIHAAMVGSSFGRIRGLDWTESSAMLHSNLIADGGDLPPPLTIHDDVPFRNHQFAEGKANSPWLSMEGAAAPYAEDMSLFMHLHNAFVEADDEISYRKLLCGLHRDQVHITIPVLFIKSKTKHANFVLSPQDSLNAQNFVPLCNSSQVWKDLQRDVIMVNGCRISGELGAEAMVGALVRHISDKAEQIRLYQQKLAVLQSSLPDGDQQEKNVHVINSEFSISEALIVECARDLIVLCNRTQSGGDTYFCVEALLCGERNDSKTILTPFSAEADPLMFNIDAVLISRNHAFQRDGAAAAAAATQRPNAHAGHSHAMKSDDIHTSTRQLDQEFAADTDTSPPPSSMDLHRESKQATAVHGIVPTAVSSNSTVGRKVVHSTVMASPSDIAREKRRTAGRSTNKTVITLNDENEADVSDSYKKITKKDRKKNVVDPKTLSRGHSSSSLVDSNGSEESDHNDPHQCRSRTPRRRRKPQLDLRGELEMDGFQFGYFGRTSSPRPSPPTAMQKEDSTTVAPGPAHITLASRSVTSADTEQYPQVARDRDRAVTMLSQSSTDDNQTGMVDKRQAILDLNHNYGVSQDDFHQKRHLGAGRHFDSLDTMDAHRDDENSVISELTFDTYLRTANNNQLPALHAPVQVNSCDEHRAGSGDELPSADSTTPVDHREHKSLLKQLGRSLKPFRMPNMTESLEGISSPFRNMRRRGSNTKAHTEHLSVPSTNANVDSSSAARCASDNEANSNKQTRSRRNTETLLQDHFKFLTRFQGGGANDGAEGFGALDDSHSGTAASGNFASSGSNNTASSSVLRANTSNCNGPFTICIRVQVTAVSRYKVCTSNPCGVEEQDTWANVRGTFNQSFLIGANGGQHLGMADRLVDIEVESCDVGDIQEDRHGWVEQEKSIRAADEKSMSTDHVS